MNGSIETADTLVMDSSEPPKRPPARVLIVEPDLETAMQMVQLCLAEGLEPKLCLGPTYYDDCPGRFEGHCPRPDGAEVVFVSVDENWQPRIVPSCVGNAKAIISCSRELSRSMRELFQPAVPMLERPYDAVKAVEAIESLLSTQDRA